MKEARMKVVKTNHYITHDPDDTLDWLIDNLGITKFTQLVVWRARKVKR